MSNITTTINIDDPVGGHQRSQRLIGLVTKVVTSYLQNNTVMSILSVDRQLKNSNSCQAKITKTHKIDRKLGIRQQSTQRIILLQ